MAAEELKKVNPGDKVEIAASTWNDFIDAANFVKMRLGTPQRKNGGQPSPCFVTVKNNTGAVLPCYSLIYLSGVAIEPVSGSEADFAFDDVIFKATLSPSPDVATNGKMAITQEPLAAGECGKAMLFGVTHATANITSSDHLFVESDGTGALVSSSDPGLPIIWSDGTTGSNKQILVLVTNGTSSEDGYSGYFKIKFVDETHIAIVDGHDETHAYCGYTDLPGVSTVPSTTLTAFTGTLYLYATHDSEGYHTHFGAYDPTIPMYISIGWIGQNRIEQYFREDAAKFGREYFL